MKRMITAFLATMFCVHVAYAYELICFTRNTPTDDPNLIILGDREIYFKGVEGNYFMSVWRGGEKQSESTCSLGSGFGIDTEFECGADNLYLDYPNNDGRIERKEDERGGYQTQHLVCRELAHLNNNALTNQSPLQN